jgi:hypothetical protein
MREKRSDYFENSRQAVHIQREYALRNPHGFRGYGENFWGLSAGDGPSTQPVKIDGRNRRFFGYTARGVPYGPDDGTIAPPAALASIAFAPEISLAAVRHFIDRYPQIVNEYRLPSGFNPTLVENGSEGWISEGYLGLDQGIVVMMIENYRSELIWKLMRQCPYIGKGLCDADFRGGWL